MRGTLFRAVGWRRMHLTTGTAAARGLLAVAGPSVNMPGIAMPSFTGPSVALLAGAMVASVAMPFVGTPPVTVPRALRTLAW
ncbi:hypothetical protein AC629_20855, partial [Bradyrhizobium sp. NAS80.1]